jgi:hypothetical protein
MVRYVKRAWAVLGQARYLVGLGIVIAAAGGSAGGVALSLAAGALGVWDSLTRAAGFFAATSPDDLPVNPATLPTEAGLDSGRLMELLAVGAGALVAVMCVGIISAVMVAVVGRIAQGSLIAGAAGPGGRAGLRTALQAGWRAAWQLIVIVSIPPIPATAGAILTVILLGAYLAAIGLVGDPAGIAALLRSRPGLLVGLLALNVPFVVFSLFLGFVQVFADRACVLNGARAIESYRAGWRVARRNMGAALILLLAQIVVGASLAALSRLAVRLWLPVQCVLQPVQWAASGLLIALFTVMWTLAWLDWTGREPVG